MREVVLKLTTQKDLVKHQSAASTFGQLKKELKQIKWSGMRVVERATKATFQMDDTVLPQGDFVLFLVPEKVKSGKKTSGGLEKLPKPIEDSSYNECRSHMSFLNREKDAGLDVTGSTDDLRLRLMEYYEEKPAAKKPAAKATGAPEKKSPKPKAEKVEEYKPTPREDDEDDEDYEDRIAFEKKAFEKKAKKAAAKAEEERLAKEKAEKEEKEKAEKKAAKEKEEPKKKETPAPTDPIEIIEDSREKINKAIDEIVQNAIHGGGGVPAVLEYTVADLEKEVKEIHKALRTSRSQAKYVD